MSEPQEADSEPTPSLFGTKPSGPAPDYYDVTAQRSQADVCPTHPRAPEAAQATEFTTVWMVHDSRWVTHRPGAQLLSHELVKLAGDLAEAGITKVVCVHLGGRYSPQLRVMLLLLRNHGIASRVVTGGGLISHDPVLLELVDELELVVDLSPDCKTGTDPQRTAVEAVVAQDAALAGEWDGSVTIRVVASQAGLACDLEDPRYVRCTTLASEFAQAFARSGLTAERVDLVVARPESHVAHLVGVDRRRDEVASDEEIEALIRSIRRIYPDVGLRIEAPPTLPGYRFVIESDGDVTGVCQNPASNVMTEAAYGNVRDGLGLALHRWWDAETSARKRATWVERATNSTTSRPRRRSRDAANPVPQKPKHTKPPSGER